MTKPIAELFILTFTRGMSLAEWQRTGLLGREWALYEKLSESYGSVVFVTFGDETDELVADTLDPKPIVIANTAKLDEAQYVSVAANRVATLAKNSASAVVRTNQMDDAGLGVHITRTLRKTGIRTGLIARGGYLRSRFVANELGTHHPQARAAADIEQALCLAADIVIGTTEHMVDDLAWRDGLHKDRCRVVPNYVIDDLPVRLGSERSDNVLLYAGQLCARKRIDTLIRGVAGLPDDIRDTLTLEIIGDGPERDNLEQLARELDVKTDFQPRLPHEQLLERMSRCAVYLQASEYEGHPKTVLEAMSTGAPVIVADTPGLGRVVENGVTGLRVPGEPETFAYAISGLLPDEAWREQLGKCAAERVRSHSGLSTILQHEIDAHTAAIESAGEHAKDIPPVRWDPGLLTADLAEVCEAWNTSMSALLSRMSPERRAAMIELLDPSKSDLAA